jgi:hypothetical protein
MTDIPVSVTRLWTGRPRNRGSIRGRGQEISLFSTTSILAFPPGYKAAGNEADHSSNPVPRLRMRGAIPPLPIHLHSIVHNWGRDAPHTDLFYFTSRWLRHREGHIFLNLVSNKCPLNGASVVLPSHVRNGRHFDYFEESQNVGTSRFLFLRSSITVRWFHHSTGSWQCASWHTASVCIAVTI